MALAESLERELSGIFESTNSEHGINASTELALERLYAFTGRPAPALVWCESPYQLATLPSILIGLFFSDAWQIVSGGLLEREVDEEWERDFELGWEALWAHGGQQLLRGMKSSSRVGQMYWQLEAGLFKQCKEQMKHWLRSGKIREFEKTLPKETIYRKFWAMQLWHLNFMQDRLRFLSAHLAELLLMEIPFWAEQWEQFNPYQERVRTILAGTSASLRANINRMGAEPANQLKHSIWLPFGVPEFFLCRMWRDNVHSQAFSELAAQILDWDRLSRNCLAVVCLDHVVFALKKPSILRTDEGGRFHCADGPALTFSDGFLEFAWHGVSVDQRIIESPETISVEEIESMPNAELRRVLIERYGSGRYLEDSGAENIQQDDFGALYKKEIPGDEPLVMVKVRNSSPEPDGSFKDYFLRVPPDIESARQAVAWTFGFDKDEYEPQKET